MERKLVVAEYKTGVYAGELLSSDGPKWKVRVYAVLRHPEQGDLHQPMEGGVGFFHQRRALAYLEVANVPSSSVRPYPHSQLPDYKASLLEALDQEAARLRSIRQWAERGLLELESLRSDYES